MNDSGIIKHLLQQGAYLYRADKKTKKIIGGSWGKASHKLPDLVKHRAAGGVLALIPASLGIAVIDLDTPTAASWFAEWQDKLGDDCTPLLEVNTKTEGRKHVFFRCSPVTNHVSLRHPTGTPLLKGNADIRGSKGYVVLWGDTLQQLSDALTDDVNDLEGWVPLQIWDMLNPDASAPEIWQMTGSRNNDLNRDVYVGSVDDDSERIKKATVRAIVQGLGWSEIHETITHSTADGSETRRTADKLATKAVHRGARLADLYHRLTPNIRNYRNKGGSADYTGLTYMEWADKLGWTRLEGAEIIAGLRVCNNMGKPSLAKEALLDLASMKHYGNVREWDCHGKEYSVDKDRYLGLKGCYALDTATGEIVKQEKDWRILRKVDIAPLENEHQRSSLWQECLETWTGNDLEMMDFLRVLCGYILYGGNPEHKFAYFYGEGANGKSTFLDAIMSILGHDYACTMSPAIYEDKTREHATVVKALEFKRLMVSGEIKPLKSWNEPMIKDITGGNVVYARRLYGDPEPMKVVGLPIFQGNHLPVFLDTTTAWGRRAVIVPFDQTIAEADRRPDLIKELQQNSPKIFMWMVDGLRMYLRNKKLVLPRRVAQFTEDYLTDYAGGTMLSDEHLIACMDRFLEKGEDEGRTEFVLDKLVEFSELDVEVSQNRTGYYKIIKAYLTQRGWEPVRMTHLGKRRRGYRKLRHGGQGTN